MVDNSIYHKKWLSDIKDRVASILQKLVKGTDVLMESLEESEFIAYMVNDYGPRHDVSTRRVKYRSRLVSKEPHWTVWIDRGPTFFVDISNTVQSLDTLFDKMWIDAVPLTQKDGYTFKTPLKLVEVQLLHFMVQSYLSIDDDVCFRDCCEGPCHLTRWGVVFPNPLSESDLTILHKFCPLVYYSEFFLFLCL